MIEQTQIDQVRTIDCRELIGGFFPLSGKGKEWEGACPWCGGADRFHVTANGWWCREGNGHCGRKGDTIRFTQEYKKLTFPQAVEFLLQWQGAAPLPSVKQDRKESAPAIDWRGEGWQQLARQEVRTTRSRLAEGLPYLASRGITQATAEAYRLGYTTQGWYATGDMRPAIVIPWYDGDLITAVRYRFIEPDPNGLRYRLGKFPKNATGNTGSMTLFRPPERRSNRAIFCEGELNAQSIYQATGFDPYAVGSQSVTPDQLEVIRQLAATYDRVLIWMDEGEAALKVAAVAPGAIIKKSPKLNDCKYDANALLQTNQLAELITLWLGDAIPPVTLTSQQQPDREEAPPAIEIGDLTDYVSQDIDAPTWAALQAECTRRYDGLWTLHADQTPTGYHITRLHTIPPKFGVESL